MFLNPDASLLLSTTTAFDAATVPAVIPSICSNSDSAMTALPIVNPSAVTTPVTVTPADVVAIFVWLLYLAKKASFKSAPNKLSPLSLVLNLTTSDNTVKDWLAWSVNI